MDQWQKTALWALGNMAVVLFFARLLFDDALVKAFGRCKDRLQALMNEWWQERDKEIAERLRQVEPLEDRMTTFEQSLLQHGRVLSDTLNTNNRETTQTLRAIQNEAAETAKAVARIEGILAAEPWTGEERRRRRRTSDDQF